MLFTAIAVIHNIPTSRQNKNPLPTYHDDDRGYILIPTAFNAFKAFLAIVQVLASQGGEVALFHALDSTWTVDLLIVSPLLCGSNPYPCGSLTYRNGKSLTIYSICGSDGFVNLLAEISRHGIPASRISTVRKKKINSLGSMEKGANVEFSC